MLKQLLLWLLAIFITLASAVYQRKTGPTYPIDGTVELAGSSITYSLGRSHGGEGDQPLVITAPDTTISGTLIFRRYKTNDSWIEVEMSREGAYLKAFLPHQPPAGKLEYHIVLRKSKTTLLIPSDENAVTRFKGTVPSAVLIPHILLMFLAILVSTRTGLEAIRPQGNLRPYVIWTVGLLFLGGMILGPWVQWYAFGAAWTGFPFGTDLTDNKTLIAMIGWIIALIAILKHPKARGWVLGASVLLMLMYLIPHSMHGSELDYSQYDAKINNTIQ
jgi:hypothetical protein